MSDEFDKDELMGGVEEELPQGFHVDGDEGGEGDEVDEEPEEDEEDGFDDEEDDM